MSIFKSIYQAGAGVGEMGHERTGGDGEMSDLILSDHRPGKEYQARWADCHIVSSSVSNISVAACEIGLPVKPKQVSSGQGGSPAAAGVVRCCLAMSCQCRWEQIFGLKAAIPNAYRTSFAESVSRASGSKLIRPIYAAPAMGARDGGPWC